jgi:hypothetical protein
MKRPQFPKEKNVMIISDYPITSEIELDIAYSAASNLSMFSDLYKVGIKQDDIYATYLSYERPEKENYDFHSDFCKYKNLDASLGFVKLESQHDLYISKDMNDNLTGLLEEIRTVKPKIIVITGKWSLFLLTGIIKYSATQGTGKSPKPLGGISKYRASIMKLWAKFAINDVIVMPILPPVTKQRDKSKIIIMSWDYKKLGVIYKSVIIDGKGLNHWLNPIRNAIIGTDLKTIVTHLNSLLDLLDALPVFVSIDIETRHNTIDCLGITANLQNGLVIPFSTVNNPNPWTFEEELEITLLLLKVLKHENLQIIGQNFSYDSQYLNKFYFINLHPFLDTMVTNHVLYNYMQKDLGFLASVYCDTYSQWKNMQEHEVK